jgi:hypothetical protein
MLHCEIDHRRHCETPFGCQPHRKPLLKINDLCQPSQ